VNSVDEALRILKNEIRKHKPVSVGLATDEAAALQQLIARGVAPAVFTAFDSLRTDEQSMRERIAAAEMFRQSGAVIANFDGTFTEGGAVQVESRLTERLREQGLVIGAFTFGSADELRTFDSKLAETISPADFRRRWCLGAPRFFHRERPYRRVAALTAKERAHITP
jgi:hypothetical protein